MARLKWLWLLVLITLACSLTAKNSVIPTRIVLIPIPTLYEGTKSCPEIFPAATQTGKIHTVRPGESLSLIAGWYGKTLDDLVQLNSLTDPEVIEIGQAILIEPPLLYTPQPHELVAPLTSVMLAPYPLYEGETACVTLLTQLPTQISARFLERDLPVITGDGGLQHLILLPVPLTTPAGSYPLTLNMLTERSAISSTNLTLQVAAGGYGAENLVIENVALLDPALEEAEIAQIRALASSFTPVWQGGLSFPINPVITSSYGLRRLYNTEATTRYHLGMDFTAPLTTPIKAAGAGTVMWMGQLSIRGNTTIIDHGWGIYTLYAHQAEQMITAGSYVTSGQVIGSVGSTGRSTGSHLHWEVWINGVPVNPMQWPIP